MGSLTRAGWTLSFTAPKDCGNLTTLALPGDDGLASTGANGDASQPLAALRRRAADARWRTGDRGEEVPLHQVTSNSQGAPGSTRWGSGRPSLRAGVDSPRPAQRAGVCSGPAVLGSGGLVRRFGRDIRLQPPPGCRTAPRARRGTPSGRRRVPVLCARTDGVCSNTAARWRSDASVCARDSPRARARSISASSTPRTCARSATMPEVSDCSWDTAANSAAASATICARVAGRVELLERGVQADGLQVEQLDPLERRRPRGARCADRPRSMIERAVRAGRVFRRDHRGRGGGAGDDDIRAGQGEPQVLAPARCRGGARTSRPARTARTPQVRDSVAAQRRKRGRGILAGPDDEHGGRAPVHDSAGCEFERQADEGAARAADGGSGLDFAGGVRGLLEQPLQLRRGGLPAARALQGPAHLAGDLVLADHDRLEPCGHREQVLDDAARRSRTLDRALQRIRRDAAGGAENVQRSRRRPSPPTRIATSRYASNRLQVASTTAPLRVCRRAPVLRQRLLWWPRAARVRRSSRLHGSRTGTTARLNGNRGRV